MMPQGFQQPKVATPVKNFLRNHCITHPVDQKDSVFLVGLVFFTVIFLSKCAPDTKCQIKIYNFIDQQMERWSSHLFFCNKKKTVGLRLQKVENL